MFGLKILFNTILEEIAEHLDSIALTATAFSIISLVATIYNYNSPQFLIGGIAVTIVCSAVALISYLTYKKINFFAEKKANLIGNKAKVIERTLLWLSFGLIAKLYKFIKDAEKNEPPTEHKPLHSTWHKLHRWMRKSEKATDKTQTTKQDQPK